jgi:hypothetical protein
VFEETWDILIDKVYGVTLDSSVLTLAHAQVVSAKLSASMQDEAFLAKIAKEVGPLPNEQKQLASESGSDIGGGGGGGGGGGVGGGDGGGGGGWWVLMVTE